MTSISIKGWYWAIVTNALSLAQLVVIFGLYDHTHSGARGDWLLTWVILMALWLVTLIIWTLRDR